MLPVADTNAGRRAVWRPTIGPSNRLLSALAWIRRDEVLPSRSCWSRLRARWLDAAPAPAGRPAGGGAAVGRRPRPRRCRDGAGAGRAAAAGAPLRRHAGRQRDGPGQCTRRRRAGAHQRRAVPVGGACAAAGPAHAGRLRRHRGRPAAARSPGRRPGAGARRPGHRLAAPAAGSAGPVAALCAAGPAHRPGLAAARPCRGPLRCPAAAARGAAWLGARGRCRARAGRPPRTPLGAAAEGPARHRRRAGLASPARPCAVQRGCCCRCPAA